MKEILIFKSKLASMLVGMTAMIAVPVVGAIAIAYTILSDIGVFSSGQKAIIWIYGFLCLFTVLYAYVATWNFLDEVWREYAVPGYKQGKYYLNLMILPVIGSFFMLYLYFEPCFKVGGTLKRLCRILISSTIVSTVILIILFLGKAGFGWFLLVAVIFCVFHYILLITIACKLAKDPIGRSAKVVITVLLISFFGAVGFMASSTWIIDSKIDKARKELEDIYGRPMTGDALKKIYYHGLKPNYKKFEKILPRDPEDEEYFLSLPKIPEKLTCFHISSLTNKKQDKQLAEWVNSKQLFFKDFDRTIKNEKYLKMPKSIRDYDNELLVNIALPQLNFMRHWARVLKMRIRNALNSNNTPDALLKLKQFERIRDYIVDDHFLISYLVAIALELFRLSALEAIIQEGNLSEKQILDTVRYIDNSKIDWEKNCKMAMYSNATVELDSVSYFAKNLGLCMYYNSNVNIKRNSVLYKFIEAPAHWNNHIGLLHALKILQKRAKGKCDNQTIHKRQYDLPKYIQACLISVTALNRILAKTQVIKTQKSVAITVLQIELYRRKYKKLPDKLSDLVPEFASEVPIDLVNGKPLKYMHGKITLLLADARIKYSVRDDKVPVKVNGYRVYSIGVNKRDDNGFQGYIKNKCYDDIGFSVIDGVIEK